MFQDNIKFTGDVTIVVTDEAGAVKESRQIKNLVVTSGKSYIASRMVGTAAAVANWMELGTGTTTAAVGDTALQNAISGARVTLTNATSTGPAATYTASFPAGTGTGAVTEAGIFNASSAGTMLCRTTFAVVNKGASDTMSITWVITAS